MAGHKKSKEERAEARAKHRAEREEKARAEQAERRKKARAEQRQKKAEREAAEKAADGSNGSGAEGSNGSGAEGSNGLGAEGSNGLSSQREQVGITPEQAVKKQIKGLSTYIKRLLTDGGKYNATLSYQIEQTATTLTIMRKIAGEILTGGSAVTNELSREGNGRVKINPLFELYLKFDGANRHNLRALAMNRENMRTADDQLDDEEDAVAAIFKQWQKEDGEE